MKSEVFEAFFSPPPQKKLESEKFLEVLYFQSSIFLSFLFFFFPKKIPPPIEMSSSFQKKFFRSLAQKLHILIQKVHPPPYLLQIGVKSQIWILTSFVPY